jgi:cystathionine beta-lyase
VRNARLVVADNDGVRAGMVASWLRQLGHEAYVLGGGVAELAGMGLRKSAGGPEFAALESISAVDAKALADKGSVQLIDIRGSLMYREGHIDGALWSIRSRNTAAVQGDIPVLLIADDPGVAALAATELRDAGLNVSGQLSGEVTDWKAAGFEIVETPNVPADADCIDYLFLTPERNQGNLDDARAYLAWEVGLLDQLDEQERGVFAITPAP